MDQKFRSPDFTSQVTNLDSWWNSCDNTNIESIIIPPPVPDKPDPLPIMLNNLDSLHTKKSLQRIPHAERLFQQQCSSSSWIADVAFKKWLINLIKPISDPLRFGKTHWGISFDALCQFHPLLSLEWPIPVSPPISILPSLYTWFKFSKPLPPSISYFNPEFKSFQNKGYFFSQDEAFQRYDNLLKNGGKGNSMSSFSQPVVIAMDRDSTGSKVYLVFPSLEEFSKRYHHKVFDLIDEIDSLDIDATGQDTLQKWSVQDLCCAIFASFSGGRRHCYEIIRDGTPCHLYFDLEFEKEINPWHAQNSDWIIEYLLKNIHNCLTTWIPSLFVNQIKRFDPLYVPYTRVVLDSSSSKKWSKHLIYRFNTVRYQTDTGLIAVGRPLFDSNFQISRFIFRLLKILHQGVITVYSKSKSENGNRPTSLIDTGVYTRNRLFRLLKSSKFGKNRPLRFDAQYSNCESLAFFATLVSNFDHNVKIIPLFSYPQSSSESSNNTHRRPTMSYTLLFSRDPLPVNFNSILNSENMNCPEIPPESPKTTLSYFSSNNENLSEAPSALNISPLALSPQISKIITHLFHWISQFGPSPHLRSVKKLGDDKILVFISNNRYCTRIQGQHKSNNVYFVVYTDLSSFCLKCLDPDCKGYSSPMFTF